MVKLVIGSVIFGVGWGLGNICPGAAVVTMLVDPQYLVVFMPAMIIGQQIARIFDKGSSSAISESPAQAQSPPQKEKKD